MSERDLFKQEISELLTNYYENEHCKRLNELVVSLSYALHIIEVEHGIHINQEKLRIIKQGKRVCIITDGRLFFLMSYVGLKLFSPKQNLNDIEIVFEELENNN